MDTYLMYGTFIFAGLLVVCWLANLVFVMKRGEPSIWCSRGLYLFGLIAVVFNAVRMFVTRDSYRGTLVFANIVAFICIVIAFVRMERAEKEKNTDPKT